MEIIAPTPATALFNLRGHQSGRSTHAYCSQSFYPLGSFYFRLPGIALNNSEFISTTQTFWCKIASSNFRKMDSSSWKFRIIFRKKFSGTEGYKIKQLYRSYKSGDAELQGKVYDKKTNEGIPFATVMLIENN